MTGQVVSGKDYVKNKFKGILDAEKDRIVDAMGKLKKDSSVRAELAKEKKALENFDNKRLFVTKKLRERLALAKQAEVESERNRVVASKRIKAIHLGEPPSELVTQSVVDKNTERWIRSIRANNIQANKLLKLSSNPKAFTEFVEKNNIDEAAIRKELGIK